MCGIVGFSGEFDQVLFSPESISSRGLFDPRGVREMVESDRRLRFDRRRTIFSMRCIELWCRMFVDQPTPSPA